MDDGQPDQGQLDGDPMTPLLESRNWQGLPSATRMGVETVEDHRHTDEEHLEHYLVFYLPRADGRSIFRVLHAAGDGYNLCAIESDKPRPQDPKRELWASETQSSPTTM